MSLFSALLGVQTPEEKNQKKNLQDAAMEMIFANKSLADLVVTREKLVVECICGPVASNVENPEVHHNFCPVARCFAAADSLRRLVL